MQKIFTKLKGKSSNFVLYLSIVGAFLFTIGLNSCKKDNTVVPPTYTATEFVTSSSVGSYFLKSNNTPFAIPIGITTASDVDRTINISVTSKTAALGTQYSTPPTSVTIKAGKYQDTLRIAGIFSGYPTGRKDTMVVKMSGYPTVNGQDTYKFVTQAYCDVVQSNLIGNYTQTQDFYSGQGSAALYTTTISNWTPTGTAGTTATILIKNFGATTDIGFGPFAPTDPATTGITANLDWSNASNFTITIPSQPYMASLYSYGAATISGSGTWSACDQRFTISYTVKVSAGSFLGTSTVMKR